MKLNTLVVDDSVFFREIICDLLRECQNVNVLDTASDGKLALQKVEQLQPDLVTLDVEMPVINGIETLKQIKQRFPETVVVMISSANKSEAQITIQALTLGAFDFIEKPDEGEFEKGEQYLRQQLQQITENLYLQKKNNNNLE